MQETEQTHELISALADGELCAQDCPQTLAWMGRDPQARQSWQTYHLIGDVLRSGEAMAGGGHDAEFLRKFKLRLERQPHVMSHKNTIETVATDLAMTGTIAQKYAENASANDASFRRKALAGMVALAVVSVIGWNALEPWSGLSAAPQLAQAQGQISQPDPAAPQLLVGAEPQRMIRDPQLDALLAAHKQFGGTSAFQMPAGFVRNATFEGPAR